MKKGFNLVTVIVIVIITSLISACTTGVILNNNYKGTSGMTYTEVMNDENLSEFLNIYSTITSKYYGEVDEVGMLNVAKEAMENYSGDDKEGLLEAATAAMLDYLGDEYTTFLSDDETKLLEDQLDGSYEGIGITIEANNIVSVLEGSPAEKAGLKSGDIITKVNNNEISLDNTDYIAVIIGNAENSVYIEIDRLGEKLNFQIEKTTLNNSVVYKMIEETDIGYIAVDSFSKDVDKYFAKALESLESDGMDSLIIDLRYNSGGYLTETFDMASIFLEEGKTIYSLEDNDGLNKVIDETKESKDYSVVILVNESSASASEILAAALMDSYGAITVGTQTYGKGKVQQTLVTSDGNTAKYTSAKWYTPNGICIDEVGITPTYVVELEYITDEELNVIDVIDSQLNKAIELLK